MGGRGQSSIGAGRKQGLTRDEMEAIEWYASGDGMWVNRYFRGTFAGGEPRADEWKLINNLDAATRSQSVKEDTLYRAVSADAVFKGLTETDYDNLKWAVRQGKTSNKFEAAAVNKANAALGKDITERGFMSTTKDFDIAKDMAFYTDSQKPILLEIHGTRGLKGLYVGNATPYLRRIESEEPQKEILLSRGVQYTPERMYSRDGFIVVEVRIKRK